MRRAVELSVREARNERRRRQEAAARLTASQLVTDEGLQRLEQKLEGLIDALRHGGIGGR
ncbi:MAG: hypothetical protein LAP87_30460 [Acidobacteriia bacterium]|nr:hypothetical protein [Terriglobia bacterium]